MMEGDDEDEEGTELATESEEVEEKLHLVVEVCQQEQEVEEVDVMSHHLAQELKIWNLEVDKDIKVKEDGEDGQAHKVYLVHRGRLNHRDLQDLKDRWDLKGR